ncbi:hypothetical protein E2C01_081108 [Portunus trituberculatus]|uniref:Uncharacterized protein n=1 Tax=Portunus trituberculatus TaxID=210409 RepID=A0A5B7IUX8_PORTR|nr:hypothetical protein [Portunus trituberculatus]
MRPSTEGVKAEPNLKPPVITTTTLTPSVLGRFSTLRFGYN